MDAGTQRENYVFGGYLVTQRVARPERMCAELLPAHLLTASACIANFVPDVWSLDWTQVTADERQVAAATLGLDAMTLPLLTSHVTAGFNAGLFGWPNVVKSAEALAELLELLPESSEWVALGLALHRNHVGEFLQEHAPAPGDGAPGVYEMLVTQASLPTGGIVMGFEPLGFEFGAQPHSWLCNHLETECFQALGIRPSENGFLQTEAEAERVTAHISSVEVGAEPVQWLPWMILDYTAEARRR